jgi:hypothetical protein
MREPIADPRFDTFNSEEKCKQCGHSKRQHFNVFCKVDGCDCIWRFKDAPKVESVTTKTVEQKTSTAKDAKPPLPPWGNDRNLVRLWFTLGRSWIPPGTKVRVWFTGYDNSTPIPTWGYDEKLRFWRQAQKREQLKNSPSVTTKRKRKKKECVTTKTYVRFQPHPKKYASNAERQAAYRARLDGDDDD